MNIMKKTTTALALVALACSTMAAADPEKFLQPAAPSNLNAVAVAADSVSLSWYDNSADERGFHVQRSEDGISWETIGNPGANSGEFVDTALQPETRYQYRVLSYNLKGESGASNLDAVVTPPLLDFHLDSGDFHVSAIVSR